MPRKKAPKRARRPKRKATKKAVKRAYPRRPMDRRVEDFAEEMGRLGGGPQGLRVREGCPEGFTGPERTRFSEECAGGLLST